MNFVKISTQGLEDVCKNLLVLAKSEREHARDKAIAEAMLSLSYMQYTWKFPFVRMPTREEAERLVEEEEDYGYWRTAGLEKSDLAAEILAASKKSADGFIYFDLKTIRQIRAISLLEITEESSTLT